MGIFVNLADFKGGKHNIPDASNPLTTANVTAIIDSYEKQSIYDLLGVTLGDLVIAYKNASATPTNLHYDKIIAAFAMDNPDGCSGIIKSLGIQEYIKASIYYEYNKNALRLTTAGVAQPDVEAATTVGPRGQFRFAENKFNDSLDTVESIQWYCCRYSAAFPDFNGIRIPVKTSSLF